MIELREATGGYRAKAVVNQVSLRFVPGAINVVVGPNGCGKSTLLRMAAGLLPPMSGELLLDGQPFSAIGRKGLARRMAYLPQSRNIPDITAKKLVLHGCFPHLGYPRRYREEDMAIAEGALSRMGIAHLAEKPMDTLSGGERQKVYIAMMLAQDGDVLFLDEPTTYLDIGHQIEMMDILSSLQDAGKTLVVVLHDLNLALRYASRIFVMQAGRLLYEGDPEALFASGLIESVFGVKTGRVDTQTAGIHFYFS